MRTFDRYVKIVFAQSLRLPSDVHIGVELIQVHSVITVSLGSILIGRRKAETKYDRFVQIQMHFWTICDLSRLQHEVKSSE